MMYIRWLNQLSVVDEPERMEEIVADVAAVPSGEFLALYRCGRAGTELSVGEWNQLVDWLAVSADDTQTMMFAKDWLTLRLWQVAAPSRLNALFHA